MRNTLTIAALSFAVFAGTVSLATAQDGRYDRDDDYQYHRDDYDRHDFRDGLQSARQIGYQDGMQVAREDSRRGKPYNPNPRGHNRADRGYEREFGSLQEYREYYSRAYSEGYSRGYHGYSNGYNR
jgi:hypothetical protein